MRRLWWLTRTAWRRWRAPRLPKPLPIILIITLVHRWSNKQDVYFGPLAQHLPNHLTLALCESLVACPRQMLPIEAIWSWTDLWRFWRACASSTVLSAFFHTCGHAIARRSFTDTRVIYPYEGRAWECSLVRGLRTRPLRILGYVHSMLKSFEDGLPDTEAWPDVWLVTGPSAQTWLVEQGHYPSDRIVVLGTLRDTQLDKLHFLVGLPSWTPVYEAQVAEAFSRLASWPERHRWTIRIRTHPGTALPAEPSFRYERSHGSWEEDVAWADQIGILPSMVGVLAYESGKPVVELVRWDFLKGGHQQWIRGIRQPMTEEAYYLIQQL